MNIEALKAAMAELDIQERMGDDVDRNRIAARVYNLLPKNRKELTRTVNGVKRLYTFTEEGYTWESVE